MEKKEPRILYRGIDWLRTGYFVEATEYEDYNLFIDGLKDYLNLPHEERFFDIPPCYEWERIYGDSPFRVRVKTTANIYPYVVLLVYEPLNISIRLGHTLVHKQIENLYQGYSPTPNILIELTGKALRPTNLIETKLFLKSFFELIEQQGAIFHGFIFSRIDYAIDLPNLDEALELALSFENARKVKVITESDLNLTFSKQVKLLKTKLKELIPSGIKHIGIGNPQARLVVLYHKTDADKELQAIYDYLGFPYGEIYPYRVEVRFNSQFFKQDRFIYTETEPYKIDALIWEAFKTIKPHLTEKFKPYLEAPHPLIPLEVQTPPMEEQEKISKLRKKLNLKDEALRLISQTLRIVKEENLDLKEVIEYAISLTEQGDKKVMERLKRYQADKKTLLKSLRSICPFLYK